MDYLRWWTATIIVMIAINDSNDDDDNGDDDDDDNNDNDNDNWFTMRASLRYCMMTNQLSPATRDINRNNAKH